MRTAGVSLLAGVLALASLGAQPATGAAPSHHPARVAASAEPGPGAVAKQKRVESVADAFVAGHPVRTRSGPHDDVEQSETIAGTRGAWYVSYDRTYAGLPVVGGD